MFVFKFIKFPFKFYFSLLQSLKKLKLNIEKKLVKQTNNVWIYILIYYK